ncbi:MAG: hypothetical protein IT455_10120 [Planctomycetes bacterium]|nr:hypothetical protein [Planctomycetota bacterium]
MHKNPAARLPLLPALFATTLATVLPAQEPEANADRARALENAVRASSPTALGQNLGPAAQGSGPGSLRLTDLSLDLVTAFGGSTARDDELGDLQGGGHDPKQRGFTLQQAELSLGGAVDPYFTAEAHVIFVLEADTGETVTELEEAFVTSSGLPYGLQAKAGMFLTEFGRLNPTHPHAWDWQDQPLALTRVFGGDGMRAPGARLSWLLPTDSYNEALLSVQNANGEQMVSFLANEEVYAEGAIGGRLFAPEPMRSFADLVTTLRFVHSTDFGDSHSAAIGASFAFGPNATGDDGATRIYGADFVYKWHPPGGARGWPFFRLQGEFLARDFETAAQVDEQVPSSPVDLPATTLHDLGGYLQGLWGFAPGWAVGLRGEWATGSGDSYDLGAQAFDRDDDAQRCDRLRLSPLLEYLPSEFSRFRLQYNYDDSDALDDPVHSVWFGVQVLIGKHPPHKY